MRCGCGLSRDENQIWKAKLLHSLHAIPAMDTHSKYCEFDLSTFLGWDILVVVTQEINLCWCFLQKMPRWACQVTVLIHRGLLENMRNIGIYQLRGAISICTCIFAGFCFFQLDKSWWGHTCEVWHISVYIVFHYETIISVCALTPMFARFSWNHFLFLHSSTFILHSWISMTWSLWVWNWNLSVGNTRCC